MTQKQDGVGCLGFFFFFGGGVGDRAHFKYFFFCPTTCFMVQNPPKTLKILSCMFFSFRIEDMASETYMNGRFVMDERVMGKRFRCLTVSAPYIGSVIGARLAV